MAKCSYFCIEEVGIALELAAEPLVLAVEVFGLVADSFEEGVVNLALDVVIVELRFFLSVLFEHNFNI